MRLLGIDYGQKKIGIAISDEKEEFAFPHSVLNNNSANSILKTLKIICDKNNVVKIIIGQSLDYKMQPNPIMKRVEKFKSFLEERLKMPVEYENEVLTTKQAERPLRGKSRAPVRYRVSNRSDDKIHSSAAALILQSYLDRNKNKKTAD